MPDPQPQPDRPVEGRDYYMDGPWLVFTREYHLRRGYCCQSGCRHCPWGYRKSSASCDMQMRGPDDCMSGSSDMES